MSTAGDTNWTGQFLKATTGLLYNMGAPFQAEQTNKLLATAAVYVTFSRAGTATTSDVYMDYYVLMPPWQGFIPTATTSWLSPDGSSSGAIVAQAVTGIVADDTVAGTGVMADSAVQGWQCAKDGSAGTTNTAKVSTGFAKGSSDFAVFGNSTALKWITILATNSCAANRTYAAENTGTRTYENVVRTAGVTPELGCQVTSATTSYQFLCTANAAGTAMDIVYHRYTDAVCTTADPVSANAPVTFTKAAKCQAVGSAFWEIQNTSFDWTGVDTATYASSICGADPTPSSPASVPSPGSAPSPVSDAATVATAAALAAGAAALIL